MDRKPFATLLGRRSVRFGQYLGDTIAVEDEEKALDRLDDAMPLIGWVVHAFSALEQSLASHICQVINDRTDEPGVIVLQGMQFRQRVDLFDRLSKSFFSASREWFDHPTHGLLRPLVDELMAVGKLRNEIVHADWGSIDEEGFASITIRMQPEGLHVSRLRLDAPLLEGVVDRIADLIHQLDDFTQAREDLLTANRLPP